MIGQLFCAYESANPRLPISKVSVVSVIAYTTNGKTLPERKPRIKYQI